MQDRLQAGSHDRLVRSIYHLWIRQRLLMAPPGLQSRSTKVSHFRSPVSWPHYTYSLEDLSLCDCSCESLLHEP